MKQFTGDASQLNWRRASSSRPGGVEVAVHDGQFLIRHLNDQHEPDSILVFTPAEWDAFISGAKDGEFDLEQL